MFKRLEIDFVFTIWTENRRINIIIIIVSCVIE